MTYSPGTRPAPPMLGPLIGPWGLSKYAIGGANPASGTWESAEGAVYMALPIAFPCVVRRVWWANGSTVSGGATIEVGIYADSGSSTPGAKIISGSATQGNASQVQFVDVADTSLAPGLYWVAIMASSATNTTVFRTVLASVAFDACSRFEEASANPLPDTATPVESSVANIYNCGFATTASP